MATKELIDQQIGEIDATIARSEKQIADNKQSVTSLQAAETAQTALVNSLPAGAAKTAAIQQLTAISRNRADAEQAISTAENLIKKELARKQQLLAQRATLNSTGQQQPTSNPEQQNTGDSSTNWLQQSTLGLANVWWILIGVLVLIVFIAIIFAVVNAQNTQQIKRLQYARMPVEPSY